MRVFASSVLCLLLWSAVVFPVAGIAQEKTPKIAILNIQQAIAQCNEGQQAAGQLQTKFGSKREELEKQQREINDLQNQLKNQDKTLSDDARNRLIRSIDEKTRIFNRTNEDATNEFQQAEQDAINEIGRKMIGVINDHAQKSGYTLVLDVSSPQTPVLYADASLDITQKVIELYNAASAAAKSSSSTPPEQAKPGASAAAPAKPAAAAPAKPAEPKPAAKP